MRPELCTSRALLVPLAICDRPTHRRLVLVPLEHSISLGSLRYPQTSYHTPDVIWCWFLETGEWNCFENHIWLLSEVIPGNQIDLYTQNVP